MTTDEFDRTARLWLDDGPTELSDRVLQAALDEIHVTTQRRAGWPARRSPIMGNPLRLALGAAAVAVAILVGINLFPPGNGGIGAPSATPSPSPTATPRPLAVGGIAPLEPGTYATTDDFFIRATITVPAGWHGHLGGPYLMDVERLDDAGGISISMFDKVYVDPCHYSGLLKPRPGASVDDMATALSQMPAVDATTPTDVTIAGYRGKQLTLTAPASFAGCTLSPDGGFRIWELPLGGVRDMTLGLVSRLWILDVDGHRVVLEVYETPAETAAQKAEVQSVFDSIHLAPRS